MNTPDPTPAMPAPAFAENAPTGPLSGTGRIVQDRHCAHCGYNLKGLHAVGRCPECGTAYDISSKKRALDRLGDTPPAYINRLMTASLAMTFAFLLGLAGASAGGPLGILIILAAMTVWYAGIIVFCLKRKRGPGAPPVKNAALEWPRAKLGALIGQPLIIPALILNDLAAMLYGNALANGAPTPPIAVALDVGSFLLQAAFLLSFFPLALLLANYADWADDNPLAGKLRSTGFIIAAAGTTALAITALVEVAQYIGASGFLGAIINAVAVFALLINWVFKAASLVAIVLFPLWLALFANMCKWAHRNIVTERQRDARVAERRKRDAEVIIQTTELADPNAYSGQLDDKAPAYTPGNMHRVDKPEPAKPTRPDAPVDPASIPGDTPAPGPVNLGSDRDDLDPYALEPDADRTA